MQMGRLTSSVPFLPTLGCWAAAAVPRLFVRGLTWTESVWARGYCVSRMKRRSVAFFGAGRVVCGQKKPLLVRATHRRADRLLTENGNGKPCTHTHRGRGVTGRGGRVSARRGVVRVAAAAVEVHTVSQAVHSAADGSLLASAQHLWTVADAAVLDAVQQIPDSAVEVLEEGAKEAPKQDWLTPVADALQTTLEAIKEQLEGRNVPYAAGWSIISLVAITKVITYPLTRTQVESSMSTQNLSPMIKAIKARYGDDKERIQAETSRVYNEAGVNPLAGCFPTLVQLPVFWGLYRALQNASADDFNEPFYMIPNLAGPVEFGSKAGTSWLFPFVDGAPPIGWELATPYVALPIAVVVSQFISAEILKPDTEPEESQKNTLLALKFLPLMVGWFALNVPAGLGLYWLANSVLTTATQCYLRFGGGATPIVPKPVEKPKVKLGAAIRSVAFQAAVLEAPAVEGGAEAVQTEAAAAAAAEFAADLDMPSVQFAGALDATPAAEFATDLDMPSVQFAGAMDATPAQAAHAGAAGSEVMEAAAAEVVQAELEEEPMAAPPPYTQQELSLELLMSGVGAAAAKERHMRALTARQCKRLRDASARITEPASS